MVAGNCFACRASKKHKRVTVVSAQDFWIYCGMGLPYALRGV
jgi:hypothetical protein